MKPLFSFRSEVFLSTLKIIFILSYRSICMIIIISSSYSRIIIIIFSLSPHHHFFSSLFSSLFSSSSYVHIYSYYFSCTLYVRYTVLLYHLIVSNTIIILFIKFILLYNIYSSTTSCVPFSFSFFSSSFYLILV